MLCEFDNLLFFIEKLWLSELRVLKYRMLQAVFAALEILD